VPPRPLAEIADRVAATRTGPDVDVRGITHDSRDVRAGDLYAALPGFRTHGAEFVADAAAAGAVAVLTDPAGSQRAQAVGLPVLVHDDPRSVLGAAASFVYGDPSADLTVVGITGTNGKTTTAFLVDAGWRATGATTGLIGTVGTRIGDDTVPTVRTTPEATDVHALLAVMRERGVDVVTMEVSSHALRLGRVDGVRFDVVGFTNLSPDHLDFHADMDDYADAKAELFTSARAARAVVCVDTSWSARMLERAASEDLPVTTVATLAGAAADWTVTGVVEVPGGSVARAHGPDGVTVPLEVALPGEFNLANGLTALALLVSAGADALTAADGIAACTGVPGRMERVPDPDLARGIVGLVDYAHTPDAVERAAAAARRGSDGRLVVVVGAGGDRDPHKRPAMGAAAAGGADLVVVTDDNPRSEDPAAIRAAVLAGARGVAGAQVLEEGDRRTAILRAVQAAGRGDVVLILGKGHEQGQEVAGTVTPFDDREALAEALARTADDDTDDSDAPQDRA
jgi:UDP-N-acetylmuramoyl-L-alanyl-D-glutamate--2,6-diaminopimelate ligase